VIDFPPMEVRWNMPKPFSDFIVPQRFGMSVAGSLGGIVRIDPPINFRKLTNRKAKRQRCKARRRARLLLSRPDPSSRRDAAWEARPLSKRQRKRALRHVTYVPPT